MNWFDLCFKSFNSMCLLLISLIHKLFKHLKLLIIILRKRYIAWWLLLTTWVLSLRVIYLLKRLFVTRIKSLCPMMLIQSQLYALLFIRRVWCCAYWSHIRIVIHWLFYLTQIWCWWLLVMVQLRHVTFTNYQLWCLSLLLSFF